MSCLELLDSTPSGALPLGRGNMSACFRSMASAVRPCSPTPRAVIERSIDGFVRHVIFLARSPSAFKKCFVTQSITHYSRRRLRAARSSSGSGWASENLRAKIFAWLLIGDNYRVKASRGGREGSLFFFFCSAAAHGAANGCLQILVVGGRRDATAAVCPQSGRKNETLQSLRKKMEIRLGIESSPLVVSGSSPGRADVIHRLGSITDWDKVTKVLLWWRQSSGRQLQSQGGCFRCTYGEKCCLVDWFSHCAARRTRPRSLPHRT